jgi:hypothetical protein
VGYLFATGKLDKTRVRAINEILFPPAPAGPEVLATQPTTQPTTQPASRLDELLAKYAGRRAGEQVELIQQSVDAQASALDRRSRELDNLMQQILREKAELAHKSAAIDAERLRITDRENQQAAQANDQGFQDSLKLYSAMPGKQAKSAFMAMPDDTVARYLQAMPPRTATKIIKEFKSAEEQERINRVMDRMRQGGGPATRPASDAVAGAAAPVTLLKSRPPAAANVGSAPRE